MATEMVSINELTLHELFYSASVSLLSGKPIKNISHLLSVLIFFELLVLAKESDLSPEEEPGAPIPDYIPRNDDWENYFHDAAWPINHSTEFLNLRKELEEILFDQPDDAEGYESNQARVLALRLYAFVRRLKGKAVLTVNVFEQGIPEKLSFAQVINCIRSEKEVREIDLLLARTEKEKLISSNLTSSSRLFIQPKPEKTCYTRIGGFPGSLGIGCVVSGVGLLVIAITIASNPIGWLVGATVLILFGLFAMTGPVSSPATPQPALTTQPTARA
jgi:hypothetical protein